MHLSKEHRSGLQPVWYRPRHRTPESGKQARPGLAVTEAFGLGWRWPGRPSRCSGRCRWQAFKQRRQPLAPRSGQPPVPTATPIIETITPVSTVASHITSTRGTEGYSFTAAQGLGALQIERVSRPAGPRVVSGRDSYFPPQRVAGACVRHQHPSQPDTPCTRGALRVDRREGTSLSSARRQRLSSQVRDRGAPEPSRGCQSGSPEYD